MSLRDRSECSCHKETLASHEGCCGHDEGMKHWLRETLVPYAWVIVCTVIVVVAIYYASGGR